MDNDRGSRVGLRSGRRCDVGNVFGTHNNIKPLTEGHKTSENGKKATAIRGVIARI